MKHRSPLFHHPGVTWCLLTANLLLTLTTLAQTQSGDAQSGDARSGKTQLGNVRISAPDQKRLQILYDLALHQPGDSVFFEVRSREKGLLTPRPEHISGDVGRSVTPGADRRIVWDALANGYELDEEVQVTVRIRPAPAPPPTAAKPVAETRKKPADSRPTRKTEPDPVSPRRGGGPAFALLSLVAPGVGNIFVQTPRPKIGLRPAVTVACYGLALYGIQQKNESRKVYTEYESQRNLTEAEPYYVRANDLHHRYFVATRLAGIIWATDIVATFVRGLRNRRPEAQLTLQPGLEFGQPVAVLKYSF